MNQQTSNCHHCSRRQELLQRALRQPDGVRRPVRLPGWQGGQLNGLSMMPAACHMQERSCHIGIAGLDALTPHCPMNQDAALTHT